MDFTIRPDPEPRNGPFHRKIVSAERIPNTRAAHNVVLVCGHNVKTFGDLNHAHGVVLCDQCETQARTALKKGDLVRVRLLGTDDEWCEGIAELVSSNGESIALSLDGMVRDGRGGFIMNFLPLIADFEKGTLTSLLGSEYELEKRTVG